MKKTVLIFGLALGAVSIGFTLVIIPYIYAKDLAKADFLGYSSMVASALLVFIGVRSYRANAAGGRLTFGRGVAVGLLITLISAACYTAAFELIYFKLMPGIGEKFAECMVERARVPGADPQKVEQAVQQAQTIKRLYDRPATNVALTFGTAIPVGLLGALVSAAVLRKKENIHEN